MLSRKGGGLKKSSSKFNKKKTADSLAYWINKADPVFSKYVKIKSSDRCGVCACITCDRRGDWDSFDAGHFVGRGILRSRFDERNCHPQCQICNQTLGGNLDVYRQKMYSLYGEGIEADLKSLPRLTKEWLQQKIDEWNNLIGSKMR